MYRTERQIAVEAAYSAALLIHREMPSDRSWERLQEAEASLWAYKDLGIIARKGYENGCDV